MSIHIITHCYAGLLPQYAEHLRFQLASLVLYPPEVETRITVCMSMTDQKTIEVVNYFCDRHPRLNMDFCVLGKTSLFRRAIGRNRVGQMSDANLIWFTDVDHVFYKRCLDNLYSAWLDDETPNAVLYYPPVIKIHKTHAIGDELVSLQEDELPDIDPAMFEDKKYNRAIGGVQIVHGSWLRDKGYLATSKKHQTPTTDPDHPFPDFKDDIAFRRSVEEDGGTIVRLPFEGLYRLRHSKTTYQGQVHHVEAND